MVDGRLRVAFASGGEQQDSESAVVAGVRGNGSQLSKAVGEILAGLARTRKGTYHEDPDAFIRRLGRAAMLVSCIFNLMSVLAGSEHTAVREEELSEHLHRFINVARNVGDIMYHGMMPGYFPSDLEAAREGVSAALRDFVPRNGEEQKMKEHVGVWLRAFFGEQRTQPIKLATRAWRETEEEEEGEEEEEQQQQQRVYPRRRTRAGLSPQPASDAELSDVEWNSVADQPTRDGVPRRAVQTMGWRDADPNNIPARSDANAARMAARAREAATPGAVRWGYTKLDADLQPLPHWQRVCAES